MFVSIWNSLQVFSFVLVTLLNVSNACARPDASHHFKTDQEENSWNEGDQVHPFKTLFGGIGINLDGASKDFEKITISPSDKKSTKRKIIPSSDDKKSIETKITSSTLTSSSERIRAGENDRQHSDRYFGLHDCMSSNQAQGWRGMD